MSHVAFVWELGAGYSYIAQFLPLVRELKARGHRVSLLLRELHNAQGLAEAEGIAVLQAPVWLPQVQGLPEPPLNYAEILLRYGYHEAEKLGGIIDAWRSTFDLLKPDLVVASHAPTALLAARSLGLPAATLGTGFLVPPDENPTPNMRPWVEVPAQRLSSSDQLVLKGINALLTRYGVQPLSSLAQLFDVRAHFLCTFAELDHYPQRRDATYYGSTYNLDMGQPAQWPPGEGPRAFVYLEPNARDFEAVMAGLKVLGCRALVCVPGVSANTIARLQTDSVRISDKPFRLRELVADCDFAVTYCGHGIVSLLLMAGVPLLMLPNHLERFLTAWHVQTMGAGILVNPEEAPPQLDRLMDALAKEARYRSRARAFAERHADFDPAAQNLRIVDDMERVMAEVTAP